MQTLFCFDEDDCQIETNFEMKIGRGKSRHRSLSTQEREARLRWSGETAATIARALAMLLMVLPAPLRAGGDAEDQLFIFDIPRQRADLALLEFAEQADITLAIRPEEVDGVEANALAGEYRIEEAVERLLADSGLVPVLKNEVVLSVRPEHSSQEQEDSVRFRIFGLLAGIAAVFSASDAAAQEVRQTLEAQEPEREEIVVTGTRIARPNLALPTPVTSVGADEIARSGAVDISDVVNGIPLFALGQGRTTNNFSFAQQGVNALNLRGLGTGRTLVLVNGRRHVGAALENSSAVDISTIPASLVERVDVITGGASAIYGADAVAGVTNFILKDDFEGFLVESQVGMSSEGDAEEASFSATFGRNFAGGGNNVTAHFNYLTREPVLARDRRYGNAGAAFVDPAILGATDSPFNLVAVENQTTLFDSANGVVANPDNFGGPVGDHFYTFTETGGVRPFEAGSSGVSAFYNVIDSELPNLGPGNDTFAIVSPEERLLLNITSHFAITDNSRFFVDGKLSRTESSGEYSAVGSFSWVESLSLDNPFIPADLLAIANEAGVSSLWVNRANGEFGSRAADNQRDVAQLIAGIEGAFEGWEGREYNYRTYFQHGRSDTANHYLNDRFDQRWFQALDVVADPATGQPVCRDPSNGCVPVNLLGPIGTISPAAIDFVRIPSHTSFTDLTQQVIAAEISGPFPGFSLPAGDVQLAAGLEYRKEELNQNPSEVFQQGLGYFGSTIVAVDGGYEVGEVFAEISAPLLLDSPIARRLDVEAAVRFADYSTAGDNLSYKGSFIWEPVPSLMMRGTYSRAVRAPNIHELFTPLAENAALIGLATDPCDQNLVNSGSGNRLANCRALGIEDPNQFDGTIPVNLIPIDIGGNPNLDVETADTYTVGAVFNPEFLTDLNMTLDYYVIEIEDYIESVGNDGKLQNVLNGCVDAASIDNTFCGFITRGPDGRISRFTGGSTNISRFETSGIDFSGAYRIDIGPGELRLASVVSHILERKLFAGNAGGQQAVSVSDSATELGNPEWRATVNAVYNFNEWMFNLRARYLGEQQLDSGETDLARDRRYIDSRWYADVQLAYDWSESISIYAGANDLLDAGVPVHPYTNPIFGPQFGSGLYDGIGQFFYGGIRVRL